MKKLSILVAMFMVVGCGKKEEKPAPKPAATAKKPVKKAAPKAAPKVVVDDGTTATINLTGNDQMRFNTQKVTVKAGRKIKVNLKHVGKLPITAMGHNFVLLKPGTDLAAFNAKAINAKATNYIPASEADNIIANTTLIGGGGSISVEFDAPAKGKYTFICSYPGHYALMKGQLIVE